ncbi:ABC transporter substrate-binding protein [Myxococcota bacterium]|nr:ABC transporter substrate-binding protein [Myxococcota bacterium]
MRLHRRLWVAVMVVFLLASPLAAVADDVESGPRAVVQETVDQVLGVLRQGELTRNQKLEQVREIVYQRFDFVVVSRLVLAKNWKRLNPQQRKEFVREFKVFLAREYGSRFEGYDDETVEILGERTEPRGDVTVRTRILGGDFDAANVDYRLRSRDGGWLVIDVVIEGISLVSNWRDQFRELLRGPKGPERLLEQLRDKNAAGAAE